MRFSDFQTETATLKKLEQDGFGDESAFDSMTVKIDPVFGYQRAFSEEDEQITGRSAVITADDMSQLETFFDPTHRRYELTYKDKDWKVEEATPIYKTGTNELEHIELTLR